MQEKFSVAELREIDRHKYFMSLERGYDVGWDAAAEDWLEHYAPEWRSNQMSRMLELQRLEIEKHLWIESEKACRDLGRDAKLDWIKKYAASWRDWYDRENELGAGSP